MRSSFTGASAVALRSASWKCKEKWGRHGWTSKGGKPSVVEVFECPVLGDWEDSALSGVEEFECKGLLMLGLGG